MQSSQNLMKREKWLQRGTSDFASSSFLGSSFGGSTFGGFFCEIGLHKLSM